MESKTESAHFYSRAFRFATHYLVLHASGSRKRGRECPVWNTGMRRTFWCGDVLI